MPRSSAQAKKLCPEALRGRVVTPPPGPKARALLSRMIAAEAPAAHTLLRGDTPPVWERAKGALVWDVDGNRYLDLAGAFGVAAVGHQHPDVVAAVKAQAGRLAQGFGDVHPHALRIELAERLKGLAPMPDARVVFAQSGAEAVELALKTAQLVTGKPGVLAFRGGYHGMSWGALEVTGWERFREPFERSGPAGIRARARLAPYGRCSRCELGLAYPSCALACVKEAGRILDAAQKKLGGVGAVLVEPILGRGGDHVPPAEWLGAIAELARQSDALLVVDEIYTGLGRTGSLWASAEAGVTPDLLCVGKALGGGYPMAAVLMRGAFGTAWDQATPVSGEAPHSATFYAHPIACAAALATLDVIEREDLVSRAALLGEKLAERLCALAEAYPDAVREVRGRGLLLGLVLASPALVHKVTRRALERGILVLPSGFEGDVVSLSPPYVLDERQVAWALAELNTILKGVAT